MAKAIRWQIPFVSVTGKHYRIDIYDEGWTGSITTLTAGPNPFTTDEDASDDFFAPIRTQTGNIEVCTALPDGGMLTLDEILPANNIARPVRLMNTDSSTIEWQGFLSCEAYSQDYVGIPQILQLPIISVLEAMASVQLTQENSSGFVRIGTALKAILTEIDGQCGMRCFDYLYYSQTDYDIFSKYIDQIILFEEKQYDNENSTSYIVSGMSAKDALQQLATFMGWVVREHKDAIYLCRIGDDRGMYYELIEEFPNVKSAVAITTSEMEDLDWRGVGHLQSVAQGAKSVEVVANLKQKNIDISLPDFPYSETSEYHVTMDRIGDDHLIDTENYDTPIDSIVSKNINFNNVCVFNQFELSEDFTTITSSTVDKTISDSMINPSWPIDGDRWNNTYIGSFMVRMKKGDESYRDGLYINLIGQDSNYYTETEQNFVFSMMSPSVYYLSSGNLRISMEGMSFYGGDIGRGYYEKPSIPFALRVGDEYYTENGWQESFGLCSGYSRDEDENIIIPIDKSLTGHIYLYAYPNSRDSMIPQDQVMGWEQGVFLSKLTIDHQIETSDILTSRGANHYYRLLGTNFRDEVSISTDLATSLNNQPSPSLIMNDGETATTEITYITDTLPELRRPEVDLLNRLAEYYKQSRQTVKLEVHHLQHPLPLLWLNGINDNKTYTPIAESRDWQLEISTLTCMELPNE